MRKRIVVLERKAPRRQVNDLIDEYCRKVKEFKPLVALGGPERQLEIPKPAPPSPFVTATVPIKLSPRQMMTAIDILDIPPAEYARRAANMIADGRLSLQLVPTYGGDAFEIRDKYGCCCKSHAF